MSWPQEEVNKVLAAFERAIEQAEVTGFQRGFKEAIDRTKPAYRDLRVALQMIHDAVSELGPAWYWFNAMYRREYYKPTLWQPLPAPEPKDDKTPGG